jgi:NAD(P)-dependent dehydrogenase (short-subunit alcohol dehydrogenase family)
MSRLDGKVVVILGASDTRSMGAETARRFASEGAKLVLAARRLDPLKPIAKSVNGIAVACDITREEDLKNLARTAVERFGKLDVAVNYAGNVFSGAVAEVTRETLLAACELHFIGSVLFFKHMAAQMSGAGSLITTSSLTTVTAPAGLAAYAGTKRGVDHVVRIAAVEYGPRGIRVNAIAPGMTPSAMTEGYLAIPTVERAFLREIPLGRLPTVTDVANAALWLASNEAFVTGQVIEVTGGQSLRRMPTDEEMMQ